MSLSRRCCLRDIRSWGWTSGTQGPTSGLVLGRKWPVLTTVDRTRSNRFEQSQLGAGA